MWAVIGRPLDDRLATIGGPLGDDWATIGRRLGGDWAAVGPPNGRPMAHPHLQILFMLFRHPSPAKRTQTNHLRFMVGGVKIGGGRRALSKHARRGREDETG